MRAEIKPHTLTRYDCIRCEVISKVCVTLEMTSKNKRLQVSPCMETYRSTWEDLRGHNHTCWSDHLWPLTSKSTATCDVKWNHSKWFFRQLGRANHAKIKTNKCFLAILSILPCFCRLFFTDCCLPCHKNVQNGPVLWRKRDNKTLTWTNLWDFM